MPTLRMRYSALLTLALLLPLAAVAVSGGPVFAQPSCGVQVGTPSASMEYSSSYYYGPSYPSNIQLTVPISLSCQNNGGQLWAVGNVYDTVANANLGSSNTVLNSYNGYFTGQLMFSLPHSVIEHLLQVQINVYSSYNYGQYGSLVATITPTFTIHSTSHYSPSSYSYYNSYPSYCYYDGGYMYCYYQSYYYYYPRPYYYASSCSNGQALIYYNGAYDHVNCYQYFHHK